MKKYLLFVMFFYLFFSYQTTYSQWERQSNFITTWGNGFAIDACDSNNAIFSALFNSQGERKNIVYITHDGGKIWNSITTPYVGYMDVVILNNNKIILCADNGVINKSIDGGQSFITSYKEPQTTTFMNYIKFFDMDNGVAMGDAVSPSQKPVFLRTTNGGDTWENYTANQSIGGTSGDMWRMVDFINPNIGYYYPVGVHPEILHKTIDGGKNWFPLNNAPTNLHFIKFYNENIGFAFSRLYPNFISTLYRTVDGGNNWVQVSTSIKGTSASDLEFVPGDSSKIWFAPYDRTHAYLYYSEDMGTTWTEKFLKPNTSSIRDIVFTDENHGWILCNDGVLFHYNNSGVGGTSIEEFNNISPTEFNLENNYPNPFNPSTTINYTIPKGENVRLEIYNSLGEIVNTLLDGYKDAGNHSIIWNGKDSNGNSLSSGIYFYRLINSSNTISKKMIMLK